MTITRNQMHAMLNHKDSPYIRCLGFLHLRFTAPPADLYDWFEPHLDDLETFSPGADKSKRMYVPGPVNGVHIRSAFVVPVYVVVAIICLE